MVYNFGLCKGRHEMPVNDFIFENEIDVRDFRAMEAAVFAAIPADAEHINLYITGLTAAALAVVSVCEYKNIGLTAWHFDRESGEYLPQHVLEYGRCAFCGGAMAAGDNYCAHCGAH